MVGLQQVARLSEGTMWTFGRSDFSRPLKTNVAAIRLDLVG